jgi:hypothetical protein
LEFVRFSNADGLKGPRRKVHSLRSSRFLMNLAVCRGDKGRFIGLGFSRARFMVRLIKIVLLALLGFAAVAERGQAVAAVTVTNVTSSTANSAYKGGSAISIQVTFSAAVTVTGTPQLKLETGLNDRVLSYALGAGSGTNTLTFSYNVSAQFQENSADLDYVSTTALVLNGGTIKDGSGTDAILALPSPGAAGSLGANKNIVIDTNPPKVSAVSSSTPNGAYNTGTVVSIQVTFTEPVLITTTPALTLETGSV